MIFRRVPLVGAVLLFAFAPLAAYAQKSALHGAKAQASEAVSSTVATITFRKVFKSSSPEYVEIKLDQAGAGTYDIRQLDDQPHPEPFRASPALTAKIFALARRLHDFNGIKLDARRRIANLGTKTFRYQRGEESYQVSFNFTVNSEANALLSIFEGLSLEDQYIGQLRNSMRYDPLGLDDVLVRLQRDLEAGLIADPPALAPILHKIASDPNLLDIARDRATTIAASLPAAH